MNRVLEPELMDDERQSIAYARADFSESNQLFVERLIRTFPRHLRTVLDIGCGPGDVVVRLARSAPSVHITAIDGSAPMIALARAAVAHADVESRVRLLQARVPGAPLAERSFDAVLSKDLLHHLPDPSVLWKEMTRLGRPGAAVFVMDLMRPSTPEAAHDTVERVSGHEDPVLKDDFYHSLCASFTVDEVRNQLADARLALDVEQVSERHMLVTGHLP